MKKIKCLSSSANRNGYWLLKQISIAGLKLTTLNQKCGGVLCGSPHRYPIKFQYRILIVTHLNKTKMKKSAQLLAIVLIASLSIFGSCGETNQNNTSALQEQNHTEQNQQNLNKVQPPPNISWSLERDNLIKRFKLQNDRAVMFFMYIFVEGVADPIGYYQVNKVSSVNSQLTNTMQIVSQWKHSELVSHALPSPAEDGSYGTNGEGIFGFTPEDIYIEHNMKYIVSTVPLSFTKPINRLTILNVESQRQLTELMNKIK